MFRFVDLSFYVNKICYLIFCLFTFTNLYNCILLHFTVVYIYWGKHTFSGIGYTWLDTYHDTWCDCVHCDCKQLQFTYLNHCKIAFSPRKQASKPCCKYDIPHSVFKLKRKLNKNKTMTALGFHTEDTSMTSKTQALCVFKLHSTH